MPEPIPYADLTNPQSLNQYVLVREDPSSFADLDGHELLGNDDGTGSSGPFETFLTFLNTLFTTPTATSLNAGSPPDGSPGAGANSNALAGAAMITLANNVPQVNASASIQVGPAVLDSDGNVSASSESNLSVTGTLTFDGPRAGQTSLGSVTVSTPTPVISGQIGTNIVQDSGGSIHSQGLQAGVSLGTPGPPISAQANAGNISSAPSALQRITTNPYVSVIMSVLSAGLL
jgi:hypothetical protein